MQVGSSRLQTVIRVKDIQIQGSQRELAQIRVQKDQEQGTLDRLEEKQNSAMTDAARDMKTRARDLQTSRAFLQSLSRQIKQQEQTVQSISDKEDTKRSELVEQSKSQQMLEKIEDKRRGEAQKEDERKAQRVIDVLAQRMKTEI
ncbi:MAG TPA: flagellar FliJ family protein [Bacteroidota bacterium]|nr:flagellar FliJ family protein [Bacteroidota bacterium]